MKKLLTICAVFLIGNMFAQTGPFSPQAGEPGSDAIHKDDALFRDWAISCELNLGFRQVDVPDSGLASSGVALYATGKADAPLTVSLGDGGVATLTFSAPFHDGAGPDFAVFENGFGSGESAFLEFAFVEVSSDGVQYFRFPATSLNDTVPQCASFENLDASLFDNLAGKYTVYYGVPFDLADLPDTSALDKQHVTHVRVIDVTGTINATYCSRDAGGRIINDPWPTNFPQSGFDLDAVGIINSNIPAGLPQLGTRQDTYVLPYDLSGRLVREGATPIEITRDARGNTLKRLTIEP